MIVDNIQLSVAEVGDAMESSLSCLLRFRLAVSTSTGPHPKLSSTTMDNISSSAAALTGAMMM
ncbi:hypothetical protein BDP27DRAFT_1310468 [Rhodocollybia butyracea]|uniref:Uncharacterized protein n=1 Tax=Rhodocollybia butyracea TaxID=206335 RepID=A0A9P5QA52_9AGAR|nr:hypothetical protein BDP27DRAFT_1310468 [Rhodocollybia butyracea]